MKIAAVNFGSSSLKFKVFEFPQKKLLFSQEIEAIATPHSKVDSHAAALDAIDFDFSVLDAVGHRVVHGGEKLQKSSFVTSEVKSTIKELSILAPLHNPLNLLGIELCMQRAPAVAHIAVFDTAFHATMPPSSYLYALPYELYEKRAVRKYGFHGISHAYLLKETAKRLNKNVNELNIITLHLGNGSSVCAIKNGKSIDTSMGFSPLEGLVMGTRCGDIDAEIVLYMQTELGLSPKEVTDILNKRSGLVGLCGANDMREILARKDAAAKQAIAVMVHRIEKYIGAYMLLLQKVDALVFSGGIGENSQEIRDMILQNSMLNNLEVFVIKTQEELEIANECYRLIKEENI
jgi:acetate kinase